MACVSVIWGNSCVVSVYFIWGHRAIYVEETLRGSMAQRKGSKPFSWVKSRQLLDPRKTWNVLSNRVCGERPTKYFSRNKLPTRFPEDIVRIKRSALQTVDGGPFKGKRLQKMKSSSFGLIAIFLRHAPDSQLFHGNIFERLRCFLNSLDLSVCEDQAIGTSKGILKSLRLLWKLQRIAVCKCHRQPMCSHIKWMMMILAASCLPRQVASLKR